MLKISQESKEQVLESIGQGRIDAADISQPNFIDEIMLKMHSMGIVDEFSYIVDDKRQRNAVIPLKFIWLLGIAAKMKIHTSLTDIPYAIMDGEVLSKFGYALWDTERSLESGLIDEGAIRHMLGKYKRDDLILGYNRCVQGRILPKIGMTANIHLLDCTELEVKIDNTNYEESSVVKEEGNAPRRGYKLGTLRGIVGDSGIIEDICFGTIKTHDLELCRKMILNSPMLKPGDALINDRGFLSRDVMNTLKAERKVDTYIPLRKNMDAYVDAVKLAAAQNKWAAHPNKKRKTQKIAFVPDIGGMWRSEHPEKDVPVNACVVWDTKDDDYYVFVTTDTTKSARQIIQTYEIRPEIEEDYRQLKDFWNLEDFKSTKINVIAFHIVCTLLGYLMFQLYVGTNEGSRWSGKSLPVILKKYIPPEKPKAVVIYAGNYFAVFPFLDFLRLYASLDPRIRSQLDPVFSAV
jgi:hypothetical protein